MFFAFISTVRCSIPHPIWIPPHPIPSHPIQSHNIAIRCYIHLRWHFFSLWSVSYLSNIQIYHALCFLCLGHQWNWNKHVWPCAIYTWIQSYWIGWKKNWPDQMVIFATVWLFWAAVGRSKDESRWRARGGAAGSWSAPTWHWSAPTLRRMDWGTWHWQFCSISGRNHFLTMLRAVASLFTLHICENLKNQERSFGTYVHAKNYTW